MGQAAGGVRQLNCKMTSGGRRCVRAECQGQLFGDGKMVGKPITRI